MNCGKRFDLLILRVKVDIHTSVTTLWLDLVTLVVDCETQTLICDLKIRSHTSHQYSRHLHWLPVKARISYKTACPCFSAITSTTPAYFSDVLQLYSPSPSLRSMPTSTLGFLRLYLSTEVNRTKGDGASSFWLELELTASSPHENLFRLQESDKLFSCLICCMDACV